MAQDRKFTVRFWGVRGSIACPGIETARYGGETSCLEVRCGERLLVFDGGTGLRKLGRHLDGNGLVDADVYYTHTHFDHICGLPFFSSAYVPENRFRMIASHLLPDTTIHEALSGMMMAPQFPIPITMLRAQIEYLDFHDRITHQPGHGIEVRTAPLNHPNRASGYRIVYGGKSICYVTDTEHVPGKPDRNVLDLVEGADLMIYDCTYTDEQFPRHVGWGHSTWQEGARLADAAGVKRLVVFHHNPDHDDADMDRIAEAAAKARPGTIVAVEGMTLSP